MGTSPKNSRNAFVSLCENASEHHWCWNLHCTTCGHMGFKVAFSKIIRGEHPDNESFWPKDKENHALLSEGDDYNDFLSWRASDSAQIKLAIIVSEATIRDIQSVSLFPDWLGYIGLVLSHCSNNEAIEIISNSFIPQFISILESNGSDNKWLKEPNKVLTIKDLEIIEKCLCRN